MTNSHKDRPFFKLSRKMRRWLAKNTRCDDCGAATGSPCIAGVNVWRAISKSGEPDGKLCFHQKRWKRAEEEFNATGILYAMIDKPDK